MKKKFSRILGVAVTLALVASLFGFAIPAAAQPGNIQWTAQPLPTNAYFVLNPRGTAAPFWPSDVIDIAVASDGQTIYAVTGANMSIAAAPWALLKSTDGGHSWAFINLSGVTGRVNAQVRNVAVAPDNPDAIAISTYKGVTAVAPVNVPTTDKVFISNTGGATWALLPALLNDHVDAVIMDLAVAPARAGTVFGREYFVAIADFRPGVARGDVQMIGGAAAWATVDAANVGSNDADFMAVAVTPNFLGDRCVVAVGADATGGVGSILHIINTSLVAQIHARVPLNTAALLNDDYLSGTAAAILAADIALPTNFDPLTVAAERAYACIASGTAANDGVFRVDSQVRWELGMAGTAWKSLAYNGTLDTGILFAGAWAAPVAPAVGPNVRYTTNMTVSAPTWIWTQKPPTGQTGRALLRVAADYATTERVFAGTFGNESAFSVSNNAGVSFDQIGLIDLAVAAVAFPADDVRAIQGMALTPDAGTVFVATDDTTNLSLWKSATPVSPVSWSRVWCRAGTTGMLRLNPLWDDAPAIFLADLVAAGNIWVSTDGGDIFATNRSAPTGITAAAIGVQDADTLYLGGTNDFLYKSTNAGFTWPYAPANPLVGVIVSVQAPITDHVLVGGTANCSYSTDGGTTFTLINVGLTAAVGYIMVADEGYADNNIVYAGGNNVVTANIFRFEIGTSTAWVSLLNAPAPQVARAQVGIGMSNGTLYGMTTTHADRALNPHAVPGEVTWAQMDTPAILVAVANFALAENKLYAANAAATMWAHDDYLATMKPVVKSPVDGQAVPVDPNRGTAVDVRVSVEPMGSTTGLVNRYTLAIWETAMGSGSATALGMTANVPFPTNPGWDIYPGAAAGVPDMAYTLQANTEYTMMFRGQAEVGGEGIVSQWSDPITVSVQAGGLVTPTQVGPILLGPVGGATNVSVTPGFSWAPIFGATEYEFILATDSALTQTVEGTPVYPTEPAWQVPPGTLDYDTSYFWGVKSTKPVESPQAIGSFRTMRAPTVFTCPICGETFDTETELSSHIDLVHPVEPVTPGYIWGIIGIGAILVIVVLVLIVRTRRTV